MGGPSSIPTSTIPNYTPNPNQSVGPVKTPANSTPANSTPATQSGTPQVSTPAQDPATLVCRAPVNATVVRQEHNSTANQCSFPGTKPTTQNQHGGTGATGGTNGHEKPSFAAHVGKDVGVNVAHHAAEHAIEHAASHAAEHAATRAIEHGTGEALAHGAAHIGGRLAAVAAPGVGAVAAGYLAVQGVKHAAHAAEKGHTGAAVAFALAAVVDGTTAAVNGAGAVSGAGVVISTPVSVGLGVVATGLSALGAWLDD